ncbi:hypothetical protein D3C71_2243550 [compost metagenome]
MENKTEATVNNNKDMRSNWFITMNDERKRHLPKRFEMIIIYLRSKKVKVNQFTSRLAGG